MNRFLTFTIGLIFITASILFLISCSSTINSPVVHYLGDTFSPTEKIDIYYDSTAVNREYKIVGRITNENSYVSSVEQVRTVMIKKAQEVGADGIIFSDLMARNAYISIKAELIKYN